MDSEQEYKLSPPLQSTTGRGTVSMVSKSKEITMRPSALGLIGVVAALGVPSSASMAWVFKECDVFYPSCRGFVIPCSLDGVNPASRPSVFGNPAVAREEYGFIRSPDGTWQAEKNCVRGLYYGA